MRCILCATGKSIRSTVAFATSRSIFSSLGIWTSVRPLKAGHTTRAASGSFFQAPIINGWVFSLTRKGVSPHSFELSRLRQNQCPAPPAPPGATRMGLLCAAVAVERGRGGDRFNSGPHIRFPPKGTRGSSTAHTRGSSTAPKGTREGPDSLFTVDRRDPFTQEPVGAPDRGAQLAIAANGAMWCITRQPALEGSTRATGDAREPTRRGGSRIGRGARRRRGAVTGGSRTQTTSPRAFMHRPPPPVRGGSCASRPRTSHSRAP
jgi:hypothetical protein